MRPILGGNVPPERVVGRDAFIRKMWQSLENQSIVLVSERLHHRQMPGLLAGEDIPTIVGDH